jgi:acetyl esterase/lipase
LKAVVDFVGPMAPDGVDAMGNQLVATPTGHAGRERNTMTKTTGIAGVVRRTKRGVAAIVVLAAVAASCGSDSGPDAEGAESQPSTAQASAPATDAESADAAGTTSFESAPTDAPAPDSNEPAVTKPMPTEPPATELVGAPSLPAATDVDFGADAADGYTSPPMLDVWAADDLENAPVLVVFHGIPTDRGVTAELAAEFSERGYVVFNADWQFNPEAPSFATGGNFHGACAVRFARTNAEQYGGNPDDVATLGYSAGGAISAVLGLNGDAISGQCASDDSVSAVPDRVIAFAGMFEYQLLDSSGITFGPFLSEQDSELWASINPYEQLDQAAGVSALLIHGSADDVIPLASTESFSAALDANGADVTTHVLDGVDHFVAFDTALESAADLVDAWYS